MDPALNNIAIDVPRLTRLGEVRDRRSHGDRRGSRLNSLTTIFTLGAFLDEVASYRQHAVRWRIEELHRTWKQGDCNVEDAQLQPSRRSKSVRGR